MDAQLRNAVLCVSNVGPLQPVVVLALAGLYVAASAFDLLVRSSVSRQSDHHRFLFGVAIRARRSLASASRPFPSEWHCCLSRRPRTCSVRGLWISCAATTICAGSSFAEFPRQFIVYGTAQVRCGPSVWTYLGDASYALTWSTPSWSRRCKRSG